MHPHRLTAWPTRLNLETPEEPDEPDAVPGLPPFLFGGPAATSTRPTRLLPGRPQPGDADPAVDGTGQLGGGAPDRRVGRARGPARTVGRVRRPRAARGARARGADPRGRRDRAHRARSPPRSPTVGPKGWVDLHLVALQAGARGAGHHARRRDAAGRRRRPEAAAEELADLPGFEGTPFAAMAGMPGMGNMMSMLAPALLGVQAGSMIGYLAQHALGRYDLPLPTERRAEPRASSSTNIDTFESEWSLPRDDLRFYVALHEVVHAADALGAVGARAARRRWRRSTCRATRSTRRRSKPSSG